MKFKKQNISNKAFTLVELIIVITILAILATIAFMSFRGYTLNSRDTNRISTLNSISKGLDLFQIKTGKYPQPENITGTGIINSVTLNYVGNISDNISRVININKTPIDPISNTKYLYGTDVDYKYYQIGATLESDNYQAKVVGNYNGLLKYNGYLYNLPSLLFTGSGNLLSTDVYFIADKAKNIPYKLNTDNQNNIQSTSEILSLVGSSTGSITGVDISNIDWNTSSGTISTILGYNTDILGVAIYGNSYFTTTILPSESNTCEDIITDTQVTTLNTLWQNGDMDIYGSWDMYWIWDMWYDSSTEAPFTKAQWCNNVYLIDTYTVNGITEELISAYNAMNNLEMLRYYNADLSTQYSYLSQVDDLFLEGLASYNPLVWSMTKLKGLGLINSSLTTIPIEIGNLTNLKYLNLSYNLIPTIPPEIGNLTNLITLYLYNNTINNIPTEIGNLTNLELLRLEYNQIPTIPTEIGNLTKLTNLNFGSNQLTTIPTTIGNLTNLTELYFLVNQIPTIPTEIGNLTKLVKLDFRTNQLTTIPTTIGNLTNLTELYFLNNQLTTIPTTIGNLTKLKYLTFGTNTLLGLLDYNFNYSLTVSRTQGGMTISTNGTKIVIIGTF